MRVTNDEAKDQQEADESVAREPSRVPPPEDQLSEPAHDREDWLLEEEGYGYGV